MAAPAQAMLCAPHKAMLAWVETAYRERPMVRALTSRGYMIEVTVSADGATWSVLLTGPGGPTCMVSHGTDWQPLAVPPNGPAT